MKYIAFIIAFVVAFFVGFNTTESASDYYLKIGDIKGESSDAKGETSAGLKIRAIPVEADVEAEAEMEIEIEAEGEMEDESGDDSMKEESLEQGDSMRDDDDSEDAKDAMVEDDDGATLRGVYIKLGDIKGERVGGGSANSTFYSDSEIRVSGVEVRGWDPIVKQSVKSVTVVTPATTEELAVLAATTVAEDENLESVSFNYGEIKWEYKAQGKLLGFIPVAFTKTITVSTDPETTGEVKIKFPWYRFLTRVDVSGKELGQEISSVFKGEGIAGLNPEHEPPTIEARASIFTTISNVLKVKHDTAMNSVRNTK